MTPDNIKLTWSRIGASLALVQIAMLSVLAMKRAFRPGPVGPGGSEVEMVSEPLAIFGYFALVVGGLLAVYWYARSRRPRQVAWAAIAVLVVLNGLALTVFGQWHALTGIAPLALCVSFMPAKSARVRARAEASRG